MMLIRHLHRQGWSMYNHNHNHNHNRLIEEELRPIAYETSALSIRDR
jgi:hypothetical protein